MDYNTVGSPPIRCDWLDVTYPADSPLSDALAGFLHDHGAPARRLNEQTVEYRLPWADWGNVRLERSHRGWGRASASGGSCEALRGVSAFDQYLALLGEHPHSLTRLDLCMDLPVPASPIIMGLVDRYPPGSQVYLTRKGVGTDYNLQPTAARGFTGTFYAGDKRGSARVTARVYDKQAERLKFGVDIAPLTRYEITIRKRCGATLRDVSEPVPLFWNYAAPALLDAPPGIPVWVPFTGDQWAPGARPGLSPQERLRRAIDASVDIENFMRLADECGPEGRLDLLRGVRNRVGLRSVPVSRPLDPPPAPPSSPDDLPPKPKKMMWQQGVGFLPAASG